MASFKVAAAALLTMGAASVWGWQSSVPSFVAAPQRASLQRSAALQTAAIYERENAVSRRGSSALEMVVSDPTDVSV
eukprot:CAMPEP_0183309354 /NCGR_PEP_ID=MMETSP0160_2-20130417/25124_1 /TAXON_ID=2839 ORGANISM="Odontella Sinensis, Strain Grunow 1884" /NCGR_SAMPLE_ID=MMETSP0160_2 /ASSEMBLY_ACC=CAM_ASM_000250 /LENGTH=76 /DNA_ID=CAMNT_0025473367 /DNA_START=57 /DNA_END=283 /DNA_ORIENTATION=+